MEGMEIHVQLKNVQSAIMYQWVPYQTTYGDVQGTHFPQYHYARWNTEQSYAAMNAMRGGANTEELWSNGDGTGNDGKKSWPTEETTNGTWVMLLEMLVVIKNNILKF